METTAGTGPRVFGSGFARFWMAASAALLLAAWHTAAFAAAVVTIDVNTPARDRASIEQIKDVAFGGSTLCGLDPKQYKAKLGKIPLKSVRMLQFEHVIFNDPLRKGKLYPPSHIDEMIRACVRENLVPHFIIGNRPPLRFLRPGPNKWTYGPTDWTSYKNFMFDWLSSVLAENSFKEVVLEVGNEFDLGPGDWLSPTELKVGDKRAYDDYLKLYTELSQVVQRLRAAYPGTKILYGGPAFTVFSFKHLPNAKDWPSKFLADAVARGAIVDFVSLHIYGDQLTQPDLKRYFGGIIAERTRLGRSTPIWLTEWGACSVPWEYGRLINSVGNPMAGSYILSSADLLASLGAERALYLCAYPFGNEHEDSNNVILGWPKGEQTGTYAAMLILSGLAGSRVSHNVNGDAVSCIAAKNGKTLTVVLANMSTRFELTPKGVEAMKRSASNEIELVILGLSKAPRVTWFSRDGAAVLRQQISVAPEGGPEGGQQRWRVRGIPMECGSYGVVTLELGEGRK